MANARQLAFLTEMLEAAKAAHHKWPAAAACEAAVETGWGAHIPHGSNNVLGIKAYRGWTGPVISAAGTEQNRDGSWTGPQADRWCVFASPKECFAEQMLIMQEPRYASAMRASAIEAYIVAECAVWSTGQAKGDEVLQTYEAHKDLLQSEDAPVVENSSQELP